MEAELGVRLFERSSHDVNLTEAGKILLEEAQALLKAAEDAAARVRAAAK